MVATGGSTVLLDVLGIYCCKFGSFTSGLHETADVLRREANLPDPRPDTNPMSTPTNRKVFFFLFVVLFFFFAVACAEQEVLTLNASSDKTTDALNFKKIAVKAVM